MHLLRLLHLLATTVSLNAVTCASFFLPPSTTTQLWHTTTTINSKQHLQQQQQRSTPPPSTTKLSATYGPKFCEQCGSPTTLRTPPGDERERSCCTNTTCAFISYQNPKIVVGAICTYNNKVLLCKRGIDPCIGKWGYPQGFMELGETTREGAIRETLEESGAVVGADGDVRLVAVYNLAGAQVQLVYMARLATDEGVQAGIESEEVGFFAWDDIPWDELAFPTVTWALEYVRDNARLSSDASPEDDLGVVVPQQRSKVYFDGTWSFVEDV